MLCFPVDCGTHVFGQVNVTEAPGFSIQDLLCLLVSDVFKEVTFNNDPLIAATPRFVLY